MTIGIVGVASRAALECGRRDRDDRVDPGPDQVPRQPAQAVAVASGVPSFDHEILAL